MGAPDTDEALPEPVDLDEDIQRRTPSGWPTVSVPPPLAVTLNRRQYTLRQGKTHEGLHALLWPISRLLVRFVEAHLPQFRDARVLELGAGVGLSGIGAAAYGSHVVLTDKDTRLTAVNVEAAQSVGVSGSVQAASCDWVLPEPFLEHCDSALGWDWVLGSDIVYHQQFDFTHIQALAKLLATLLAAAKEQGRKLPTILFGYQERDSAARLAFWEALASHGLGVTVHTLDDLAAEGVVDVSGLSGPMALWFIAPMEQPAHGVGMAPAEASDAEVS